MPDKNKQEEAELRPSSAPPEDVEIPTDTIYGSNEPLDPIDEEPEESEPQSDSPPTKPSDTSSSIDVPDSNIGKTKSIKIGWLPLLLILLLLSAGIFVGGSKFGPALNKSLGANQETETPVKNDSNKTNEPKTDSSQPSQTGKPRKTINFVADSGIYRRDNKISAETLAKKRLDKAKTSVLWVTSEPNNRGLLAAISEAKETKGLPIIVVTGKETSNERIQEARKKGLVVNQTETTLEVPYSFIIIDSKLLMDLSRRHWLWETTDKQILNETGEWLEDLTKNATIIKK